MKKRTPMIIAGTLAGILALGGVSAYAVGQLAKAAAITEEDAIRFALIDAGVTEADAAGIRAKYEIEDGIAVYDVDFVAGGVEYDYDIKADDGTIVKREIDSIFDGAGVVGTEAAAPAKAPKTENAQPQQNADTQPAAALTLDEAKAIALAEAGCSEADVIFTEAKLEWDDGAEVYDIDFFVPDEAEYDYEIDASTGAVREKGVERIVKPAENVMPAEKPAAENAPDAGITVEDAKSIALERAGKSADEVVFSKAKLEKDDGRWVYEIEFCEVGVTEFEYEIDASDGTILDEDVEAWDD